ncbi:hypothetical protein ON010_g9381 [Phytophthora cinnamomi]|nr:hypothetical protein ON010_g9381 [Phytophthora cinnamomi]
MWASSPKRHLRRRVCNTKQNRHQIEEEQRLRRNEQKRASREPTSMILVAVGSDDSVGSCSAVAPDDAPVDNTLENPTTPGVTH